MEIIILICIAAGIYNGLKSNRKGFWYGVGRGLRDIDRF